MIAIDSSVAIAAFGEWHELNDAAAKLVEEGAAIPAHALLETYSVLTGFPPPHRAPAEIVGSWLEECFPRMLPPPSAEQQRDLVRRLARAGRIGGAVLDTFTDEPLISSSTFYDLPNVIVTPHTSLSSGRVLDRSVELFCDNLRRFASGEPLLNRVDPTAGY